MALGGRTGMTRAEESGKVTSSLPHLATEMVRCVCVCVCVCERERGGGREGGLV